MDPAIVTPVAASRSRGGGAAREGQQEPHYYDVEHHGRLPPQPTYYVNSSVSPSHSSQAPPTGLGSTPIGLSSTSSSEVRSVSPSPGSHGNHSGAGADRIKQMEREIHLLRMSVNDKDAQLTQVQRDLGYSHDQIKQLNVLLAEKKESILTYQERISEMQSEIGSLREASIRGLGQPAVPDVRAVQQANESLQLQMTQLRAQLAEVNRQNTELRSQNRDLLWQLQQVKQQQPPLRASTANGSEELHRQTDALRQQHAEAVRDNQILRSRVEILTHQVTTYNEDFKAERSDRERAQATIQEQKDEMVAIKQMVVVMARDHGIQLDTYGLGHLPRELQ